MYRNNNTLARKPMSMPAYAAALTVVLVIGLIGVIIMPSDTYSGVVLTVTAIVAALCLLGADVPDDQRVVSGAAGMHELYEDIADRVRAGEKFNFATGPSERSLTRRF